VESRHRILLALIALLAVGVVAGAAILWPDGPSLVGNRDQDPTRVVGATLTRITTVPCRQEEQALKNSTCAEVEARRADNGQVVRFAASDLTGDTYRTGQRVNLAVLEQPGQPPFYSIRDIARGRPMLLLAALFVGAVVAFGRWQGVRSLVGLVVSFLVIVGFIVPSILSGHSPVSAGLVGALAITIVSLHLAHGLGRKTTAAVVGTALALGLTALLSTAFVAAATLTGIASDEARSLNFDLGGISLRGLLLAGIVIGGLGVLDDVTTSQASLVFELHRANPAARLAELVRGALAVGRDHVAATVNTLFLAYAGASLPLLVLFVTADEPVGTLVTTEVVAVEVVRTLCGSVGLIAAVPLTTLLAAILVQEEADARAGAGGGTDTAAAWPGPAGGHVHGLEHAGHGSPGEHADRPPEAPHGPAGERADRPHRDHEGAVGEDTGRPGPEDARPGPLGGGGPAAGEPAPADPWGAPVPGRSTWTLASGLNRDELLLAWSLALEQLGPVLSHAAVGVVGSGWLTNLDELPAAVQEAAAELERLAAADPPPTSWYRRRPGADDSVRLDLRQPRYLELVRTYGPYSLDTAVYAEGDPRPVLQSDADGTGGLPRVTLRLDQQDAGRLRAALDRAGLRSPLVPTRTQARTRAGRRR
jgi:uncharacterized membrane protein